MKRSRFSEEQIIGILKEQEAERITTTPPAIVGLSRGDQSFISDSVSVSTGFSKADRPVFSNGLAAIFAGSSTQESDAILFCSEAGGALEDDSCGSGAASPAPFWSATCGSSSSYSWGSRGLALAGVSSNTAHTVIKEAYTKAFLKLTPDKLVATGYETGNIEKVLDALIEQCTLMASGELAARLTASDS